MVKNYFINSLRIYVLSYNSFKNPYKSTKFENFIHCISNIFIHLPYYMLDPPPLYPPNFVFLFFNPSTTIGVAYIVLDMLDSTRTC